MLEKIKSIGATILGFGLMIGIFFLIAFLLNGVVVISEKVLPFLMNLTGILTAILVIVLTPLAFFKKTREWSATGIYFFSYVFGLTLWFYSALISYVLWGFLALIVGLVILGIGVFPIALLASIFNGEWSILGNIVYLAVLTYGCRVLAMFIASKIDNETPNYNCDNSYSPQNDEVVKEAEIFEAEDDNLFLEEAVDTQTKFCVNCGKEISVNSSFCKFCGKQLN
jgi:hypothetical protein